MDAQARIRDLCRQLNEYSYRYYVEHAPVVTDAEFDALYRELQALEQEHPEFIAVDSPTQRAGSDLSQGFQKVAHASPILSLANAFSEEDLSAWQARIKRLEPEAAFTYTVEPKFDGLAIVLTYEQGILVRAATRGNGEIGDDVTASARTIQSIPLRIPVAGSDAPPPLLVVRGEVLFTKEAFAALNEARKAEGEPAYVNARNTASGSLKQKDARLTAQRDLTAFAYEILHVNGQIPDSRFDRLQWLDRVGFLTPPDVAKVEDLDGVTERITWWRALRESLSFEIDGLVVKLDDIPLYGRLGVVGKDPRGAIAFKFPSEEATTKLLEVKPQIGRTGRITPTAHLDPVFVGGVTVSRATLHNYEQIEHLDIREGDVVVLKRSGDVIPYVMGPVTALRSGEEKIVSAPTTCPVCDTQVNRREGFVDLFCPNEVCPERVFRKVSFLVSKEALDIEGLGPKTLSQLIAEELISDEADLFTLTADQLLPLEGFADRKTEELIKSIDAARTRPLKSILTALGIPGVGGSVATLLIEAFNSLDALAEVAGNTCALDDAITRLMPEAAERPLELALQNAHLKQPEAAIARKMELELAAAPIQDQIMSLIREILETVDPLLSLDGIGTVLAEQIISWFGDPSNVHLLSKLKSAGLALTQAAITREIIPLDGLTFVITGTLPTMSRAQAKTLIEDHGGKVTGSVSGRTSYLVAGENAGSKLTKAQRLQIPVLDEAALHQLIQDDNT